jgi:3-hydroxybutyryl-CoA dehydrogenase
MKLGTNVPMGPLTLADFIGLDTCLAIMRVLHTQLGDSKYRPSPLLVKYVDAGWYGMRSSLLLFVVSSRFLMAGTISKIGRKSGRGFYEYKQ